MKHIPEGRRKFLKNLSLASLSAGLFPAAASAHPGLAGGSAGAAECFVTTLDFYGEGPFYTPNPPLIQNNQLAAPGEPGERLILSGQVRTLDCAELIPNTAIDLWHANDAGQYDNQGYNLRGIAHSNAQGFYLVETILPGHYPNGGSFRPSHIHVKVTPPGFETLTTQLYFEGDEYIPGDAAASINSGPYDATHRIIPLTLNNQGKYEGTWDIVVDGDGTSVGINELHLDKGMIYSAGPNPFTHEVNIRYGVFREAKIGLFVYDLHGRSVARLEEKAMRPEKYTATWRPESGLPGGYYFIALKVNDLQVHYMKVLKQG